jgi:hypothetical protein
MYLALRDAGYATAQRNRNVPWISTADDGTAIMKVWRSDISIDPAAIFAVINARTWWSESAAGEAKRKAVVSGLESLHNRQIRVIVVESKNNSAHTGTRYDDGSLWLVEDAGPGQPFFLWRGRPSLSPGAGNPVTPEAYGRLAPERREVVSNRIERDGRVRMLTLLRAEHRCEFSPCKDEADYEGLDVHHITRLGDGGDDHTDNTVALCPACHSRVHRGKSTVRAALEKRLLAIRKRRQP